MLISMNNDRLGLKGIEKDCTYRKMARGGYISYYFNASSSGHEEQGGAESACAHETTCNSQPQSIRANNATDE